MTPGPMQPARVELRGALSYTGETKHNRAQDEIDVFQAEAEMHYLRA